MDYEETKNSYHVTPGLQFITGRICMAQLAVDITDAKGVELLDVATLIDSGGCIRLSASSVAKNSGSISNELLCRMEERLPVIIK